MFWQLFRYLEQIIRQRAFMCLQEFSAYFSVVNISFRVWLEWIRERMGEMSFERVSCMTVSVDACLIVYSWEYPWIFMEWLCLLLNVITECENTNAEHHLLKDWYIRKARGAESSTQIEHIHQFCCSKK